MVSFCSTTERKLAQGFLNFVDASPSPFHAVRTAIKKLEVHGYTRLREREAWDCKSIRPGGKYYVSRNGSALVAFTVGREFKAGGGFAIVGAHTDSPCLKVKPCSARRASGYLQVGVQLYGGGLWHTWFDRDLGIAGRVVLSTSDKTGIAGERLVEVAQPILRIPTLAIHLDHSVKDAFKFNTELQLRPLLGCDPDCASGTINDCTGERPRHHAALLERLASGRDFEASAISDVELCLYDMQPSAIGGLNEEYIFAPRCDNLVMSYCALEALCEAQPDPHGVALVALFDNEEVGSLSAYGAQSWLLPAVLRRVAAALQPADAFDQSVARSLVISADMAHAVHPNYADKHEDLLRPKINGGVVLKHNANQRYATTAATASLVRALARRAQVPLQDFAVRNDSPCGTTIGPILAGALGVRCVDVGNPQLSMHSIREQAGVRDIAYACALFGEFFGHWSEVDNAHDE